MIFFSFAFAFAFALALLLPQRLPSVEKGFTLAHLPASRASQSVRPPAFNGLKILRTCHGYFYRVYQNEWHPLT